MRRNVRSEEFIIAANQHIKEKEYWLKQLSGDWEKSSFPVDVQGNPGERDFYKVEFSFCPELCSRLAVLSKKSDRKLHIILASGLVALLDKYTGNRDIVIGTPIYKQNIQGDFINTVLVLRNQVEDTLTFKTLVLNTKQVLVGALEHRDYPVEILAEQLNRPYEGDEDFPLFDVALLLENIQDKHDLRHTNHNILFSFLRTGDIGDGSKNNDYDDNDDDIDNNDDYTIRGLIEYNSAVYEKSTIIRISHHFALLLERAVFNADLELSAVSMVSASEKQRILFEFNRTGRLLEREKTYCQWFEEQVSRTPHRVAVLHEHHHVTFCQLDREANRAACLLIEKGVTPGVVTAVHMKRSIKLLIFMIGIFKANSTYLPLDTELPEERIIDILANPEIEVVITGEEDYPAIARIQASLPQAKHVISVAADERENAIFKKYSPEKPVVQWSSQDTAYIIYTSGSTGKPKGVMIHHLGMINHLQAKINDLSLTPADIIAQTASIGFDISIWQFFAGLLVGGCSFIIDKEIVLQPVKLLRTLQKTGVTILETVPSLLAAFLDMIRHERDKDLRQLRWLIPTGEALTAHLVREWYAHFSTFSTHLASTKIMNAYGPTEAADDITHYVINEIPGEKQTVIPIGKPVQNMHVYILDRNLSLCPPGVRGEICTAGFGVGKGYWKDPEKTAGSFIPNPFSHEIGDQRYAVLYKTGDCGYFREDGQIVCLGRLDNQVKIRGNRIEPGEIENCLCHFPGVQEAVVTVIDDETGDKALCAYIVGEEFSVPGLREYLQKKLPEFMIPSYFVRIEHIPLTANGKVDRGALPHVETGTGGALTYTPPRDETEKKLAEIWSDVLGGNREPGIDDNFFAMGGHSLKATILVSRIHKALDVEIPLKEVFNSQTIRKLAQYISGLQKRVFSSINPGEQKEYYPLSPAQKRLFILARLEEYGTSYNIPGATLIEGKPDKNRLNLVFHALIKRHETLRTSFELRDGEPVQRIHPAGAVVFECQWWTDLGSKPVAEIMEQFIKPFDLARPPLLRVGLIGLEDSRYILVYDMHHITADGTSLEILIDEFIDFYSGREFPGLRIQYKDFSEWQNHLLKTGNILSQEEFWLEMFQGEIPVLNLSLDYPRPAVQSFAGDRLGFTADSTITHQLKQKAEQTGATLYIVILAAYNILMARYAGQEDIIVGSHVAGRSHADLEKIIGMFVNPLPIRNYPVGTKTLGRFLEEVKNNTFQAYENQDYPFEELLDKLDVKRDPSRNPLFDSAFTLITDPGIRNRERRDKHEEQETRAQGLVFKSYDLERRGAKFDIILEAVERNETIEFLIEYRTKLFKREKIQRMTGHFVNILKALTGDLQVKISQIEILTEAERQQVLEEFNATEVPYHSHQTIPQLFAVQVSKTPDRVAVVWEDRQLTYRELSKNSRQMARVLRGKGVKPDTIVGIMMDRCLEMVICILAILEAGGAYLPLDVTFPTERLQRVMEDCDLSLLLTQTGHLDTHWFTRLQGRAVIGDNTQITGNRPQISDFNAIPIPDRSMVDYEKYNRQIGLSMSKNCITMQATRGCPYHCAYCHKLWPKKHVARSAENIFEEVKLYYDMGIRRFAFIDDIFNLKVENSSRFLELIIKNKMDIQIYLCLRGDILSKDYIDLMVEAGVLKLALALETASPRLQKLIGKHLKIEKLRENTHYVCNRYPQVVIDLMTMHGFPTETEKEAIMTLDFIKEMKWLHFPYVHILKIYPNTEMERLALENGITRQAIARSVNLAYHEIPETLPFDRSFTLQYQAEFTNEYFLSKERLKHVIPFQKKILTEDEFVQKYNSYLPVDIRNYRDFLDFSGISAADLGPGDFLEEAAVEVPHFNKRLKEHFPVWEPGQGALRVLLLDLSKYYSDEAGGMLYDVLEQPLGLMYLMTYLKERFGDRVHGKIAKSRIDFNSDPELNQLVERFKPDIIGIRTLAFYKNFFHKTVALLRQWFPHVPIISGGPYATSNYAAVLQDRGIQLVVLGEGELTFTELIAKILENGVPYRTPSGEELKQIPGLAFIPDRDKLGKRYSREIILVDQLLGSLPGETVDNIGDNLVKVNRPGDLAYIMYTSGSTGKPKGVMTSHGNVVDVLEWFGRTYGVREGTHVLQISDYTFDPSVEQIFGTLIHGGTFFILNRELIFNRQGFVRYIERHGIQIINFIPSFLDELLGRGKRLKSLEAVIPGGEKLEESTKTRLLERGYPLYNQYGPTETTIDAISTRCTLNSNQIGKPIANTRCYILDRAGKPVPIGVTGELHISGEGISRGYLNHPEQTSEKYQPELESESGTRNINKKFLRGSRGQFLQKAPPGRRSRSMYKTGDLVRWHLDGSIEFIGREDSQVKIRGHRIEPIEIENMLERHPAVKQALVLLKKSGAGQAALNKVGNEERYGQVENIEELVRLLEGVNPQLISLYLDELEGESGGERGSENVRVVRTRDFEIILKITDQGFIRPPREHQRNWHIQRAIEEFKEDLIHLDRRASGFVAGSGRKLITGDLKTTEAHIDDTQLIIDGQQVMQDWQHPLMKKMAQIAAESHGDVLEIGFGMGISADYIIEAGVKSYTVVECNERVVEHFRQWSQRHPGQNIRLVQGKWQEVLEQLGQYDAVFFDTYPLDEEEYYEHVINSVTYAEHFFPAAFSLLRPGGIFTYYTNEIDSFSRRHQRLVLKYFDTFSLSVVKSLTPPADCKNWWADSMVVIKAVKERNSE